MQKTLRYLIITLGSLVITGIILAAVMLGLSRLFLPMIGQYRAEIEQEVSLAFNRPIKLGAIEAHWEGINPHVQIKDLRLMDQEGKQALIQINEAQYSLNILHYLRTGQLTQGNLMIAGTRLPLHRSADGRIVVEGFETPHGKVAEWVFAQAQFGLEQSDIQWRDDQAQGQTTRTFSDVDLLFKNHGERHQINGSLALPDAPRQRLTVALDFSGEVLDYTRWTGNFYLQGAGLSLVDWLGVAPAHSGISVQQAYADFRLWGEWKNAQLQHLEGESSGRAVRLVSTQPDQAPMLLERVSGQLKWQRREQGWSLDVNRFVVQRNATPTPASQFSLVASAEADQAGPLAAQFSLLRLEDAAPLLLASDALAAELRSALLSLAPRGELKNLQVQLAPADPKAPNQHAKTFSLRAQLLGVSTQGWEKWPALHNIDALVSMNERTGIIELNSQRVKLEFANVFRAPIILDSLIGQLQWQQLPTLWRVATKDVQFKNADVNASLAGMLDLPEGEESPYIDLNMAFDQGKVASVPRYLPINLLPGDVLQWLDRSLVGGYVPTGSARILGRLADFPFSEPGQGNFEVRFTVDGGVINYAQDWPWISQLQADLVFSGKGLQIKAHNGRVVDADIVQAQAVIPDMTIEQPELTLQGKVQGGSENALRFIKESPLKAKFGQAIDEASATGQSQLDLDLLLPLGKGASRVQGKLALADTSLQFATKERDRDITLNNINGVLNFTEASISGQDITASVFEQKGRFNLHTQAPDPATAGPKALFIEAQSSISAAELAKQAQKFAPNLQPRLLQGLSGATDWSMQLQLRTAATANASNIAELTLKSSLQGMGIDLPEPLAKAAQETIPLLVKVSLEDDSATHYSVQYGARASAVFEVTQGTDKGLLKRGELRLGAGNLAALPVQGLRVSGALPYFSLSAWRALLAEEHTDDAQGGLTDKLDMIDVQVDQLEAFKQALGKAQIKATHSAQAWSINVTSEQVAGTMHLPSAANAILNMEFERLHLAKNEQAATEKEQAFDPRELPALRLTSASFKYGDLDLGRLEVEAGKRPAGLQIDKLTMASPALQVKGKGDWLSENNKQVSRFDLGIDSAELGKALAALGYSANNIVGGKSHIDLQAHWAGSPMDLALERLNGTLTMNIEKGRFLDIEPGAGRVFGLLSIQTLPRRLSLDFSDLFAKGFAFDHIGGDFKLENGNAFTENLVMTGPPAIVTVTGRTGLGAKDYDQLVTVKPQIGASLPLAGGLAGGPAVAAAIFLAQKIFKPQIDDIAGYQYTIKGTWQDPKIEPFAIQTSKGTND